MIVRSVPTTLSLALGLAAIGQAQGVGPGAADPVFWNSDSRVATRVSLELGTNPPFGDPGRFQILPLELTARDGVDQWRPDLAQTEAVAGISTIHLVDGARLVHFRSAARGTAGFLKIDSRGPVQPLLELPLAGNHSPFLGFAAVHRDGEVAAVVTSKDRVGAQDVYLLRLDGGIFARSGTSAQRITSGADAEATSLTFSASAIWFGEDFRILRAPIDGSSDAVEVKLPPSGGSAPAELAKEFAVSEDGSTLVALAGQTEKLLDLYVLEDAGVARNLTEHPSTYQPVGHLPFVENGPTLSLSPDGAAVTYGDETPDLEYFHRLTDGSDTPVQLTSDTWFEQSLDEGSSIITALASVVIAFGERPQNKDLYQISLAPGAVQQVQNLTQTSGDAVAPFQTGAQLLPVKIARVNGGDLVWILDDVSGAGIAFDLWTSDPGGSRLQAAGLLASPVFVSSDIAVANGTGSAEVFGVLEDATGSHLVHLPSDASQPLEVLLDSPKGVAIGRPILRPDLREVAFVAEVAPGTGVVATVAADSGRVTLLTPVIGSVGSELGYTDDQRLLFTYGRTAARGAFVQRRAGSSRTMLLPVDPGALHLLR